MKILVTGGAGFIGSHTLIELYKAGHTALVVDNLYNANPEALRRVADIIGIPKIPFVEAVYATAKHSRPCSQTITSTHVSILQDLKP